MKKLNPQRGFTLVEILVGVLVFSLIIGAAANLFFSSIASQRRILAIQQLVSQSSFLQEHMGRAVRQAKKELSDPAVCLTGVGRGYNYEITHSGQGLKFINRKNQCHEFFLQNKRIVEAINGVEQFITPDELEVSALNFAVLGESQNDNLQPRASFFLDIRNTGAKPESEVSVQTQTTISQRNIDALQ